MMFNINDVQIIEIGDKITSDEFKKLVYMWVRDYRANGDKSCDPAALYDYLIQHPNVSISVAVLDERLIGFVSVLVCNNRTLIEFAYTLPKYRNMGIATKLYVNAIKELNANEIELSFKRVKDRVDYWKKLGFQSFRKRPDQGYSFKSICYLSQEDHSHDLTANPLDADILRNYLKYQDEYKPSWEKFMKSSESINAFENLPLSQFGNINMQPKSKLRKSS